MSSTDTTNITCFDYNGRQWTSNDKCPDSNSCCSNTSQCQPNRLCLEPTNGLVRASCSNFPWTSDSCAQICLYQRTDDFLPRVNVCPDGSYCCDDDPNCCADHTGVFLDSNGAITGRANDTTTTTTAQSTAVQTTSSISPSTSAPTATALSQDHTALSAGAAAGVGVGSGIGAIGLIASIFVWMKRRRRARGVVEGGVTSPRSENKVFPHNQYEAEGHSLQELDDAPVRYFELESRSPSELPTGK